MPGNIYIMNIANITMPKNGIIPANISIKSDKQQEQNDDNHDDNHDDGDK